MAESPERTAELVFWRPADGSAELVFGRQPDGGDAIPPAAFSGTVDLPYPVEGRVSFVGGNAELPEILPGELVFWQPRRHSAELVFGLRPGVEEPTEPVAPPAEFQGAVELPYGVSGTVVYDSRVDRPLLARVNPTWQDARPQSAAVRSGWQDSDPLTRVTRMQWQRARPLDQATRVGWQASQPLSRSSRARWQRAQPATSAFRAAFQQAIARRAGARQLWQRGQPLTTLERLAYQETLKRRAGARINWQPAQPLSIWRTQHNLPAQPAHRLWRLHYQDAARLYYDGRTAPPVEPEHRLCYCPETLGQLIFREPHKGTAELVFVCRPCVETPPGPEIPDGDVVVRARRTYVVINRIDIRRADDDTPLRAEAFAMQLDSSSWTWSFSASFAWDARDALMPDGSGPVHLVATVNGVDYRFVAEQVSRSVRFPTRLVNVRGRGRAAMLDAPYAQTQTWAPSEQISAQQLMDSVLTVNGVGIGWALQFELTDWLIPGGAWAHQGTYISALNDIAGAVGGYLQPHATDQKLLVLPTWPLPWWRWDEVTPNISLPNGVAELEETEWREQPDYNRVFVHGMSGGIIGQVTREGSAGDKAMPTAVHALITATEAARQRGQHELARSGTAIRQRLVMPVLPETGIIVPGKYVKYNDGSTDRLGITRAVSVDWSWPALTQTVELEGHE